MGDPSRFRVFAATIAASVTANTRIADVAGGSGGLRTALFLLGIHNVTTIDKRPKLARGRKGEAYRFLDWQTEPDRYDCVVAMHPDQATDHAILFAARCGIPAMICPCCIMPSAADYGGRLGAAGYFDWVRHLKCLAQVHGMTVTHSRLNISGRNDLLVLMPKHH